MCNNGNEMEIVFFSLAIDIFGDNVSIMMILFESRGRIRFDFLREKNVDHIANCKLTYVPLLTYAAHMYACTS